MAWSRAGRHVVASGLGSWWPQGRHISAAGRVVPGSSVGLLVAFTAGRSSGIRGWAGSWVSRPCRPQPAEDDKHNMSLQPHTRLETNVPFETPSDLEANGPSMEKTVDICQMFVITKVSGCHHLQPLCVPGTHVRKHLRQVCHLDIWSTYLTYSFHKCSNDLPHDVFSQHSGNRKTGLWGFY